MKILQLSSAQSLGGGERHLSDLTNGLARRGHDVFVALRPKSPLIAELKNVPDKNMTTLPLRNSLDAPSARELARFVSSHKIQIVHAHMARDYPLAAYAARRSPGARLIITRHVLFALNRLHRITLSKAARIIAVSEAVASKLKADKIVDPEKVSVVLNGIDTNRFAKTKAEFDRKEFLQRWNLPPHSLLVATVGELTPLKGQEEFLRAAVKVVRQVPQTRFVIAGLDHSGGKKHLTRITELIAELNLKPHVSLVGWLEDLDKLYSASDVFVSASHTESFGLSIAEAMASGTAVVATETEGARELIKTEGSGLLVPIGDVERLSQAVMQLLQDKELRARLGRGAQQAASLNFSVDRMILETEKIYQAELH